MHINNRAYQFVATSLDNIFDLKDNKIFAGEWCFRDSSEYSKINKSSKLLHHPWLDTNLCKHDYAYLQKLIDTYSLNISDYLNCYHGTLHSEKYWNILILPWLTYYLPIHLHKWRLANEALSINKNLKFCFFEEDIENTPVDYTVDFYQLACENDYFNYKIFKKILIFLKNKNKNIEFVIKKNNNLKVEKNHKNSFFLRLKLYFYILMDKINLVFSKRNNIFFEDKILSKKNFIKLNIKLNQYPQKFRALFNYHFENKKLDFVECNQKKRRLINFEKNEEKNKDSFEEYIDEQIKFDIPKCFLEGYNHIDKEADGIKISPKIVFSGFNHYHNEKFKFWIAKKVLLRKTKFFVTSHGGGNQLEYCPCFQFEKKIVDKKITWTIPRNRNDFQLPATKFIGSNLTRKNPKYLVYLAEPTTTFPARFIISAGSLKNKEIAINLKKNLKNEIVKKLKYLPSKNFRDQNNIIKKELKGSYVDQENTFHKYLQKSKIVLCTYTMTGFLEAILTGPTVLIHDFKNNPLMNKLKKIEENMVANSMAFKETKLAINHINNIWHDPYIWWNSNKVQNTVEEIKNNFCKTSPNSIEIYTQLIKSEMKNIN